jgi:hypothetical protein
MSTFNLSNRVKLVNASPNVDDDYGGPYANMAAATIAIPTLLRKAGKTVGIYSGTEVREYWWPDDLTLSSDPVLKLVSNFVTLTVVDVPGTTYLLSSADSGKILQFTSSSPITVTVPSGLTSSQRYLGKQLGTGQITFVGSGATLNKAPTEYLKTASQYSVFAIDWTSSETYMVYGRLELI